MSRPVPMDCEDVLRHLFEWLDGELGDEREAGMTEHLARCRSCFSRAAFERRLKAHLREVGHAAVPADVDRRIRSVLDQLSN